MRPAPASDQGRATHAGWGGAGGGSHRVSRLGDPDHEDQLGREECCNQVPVDTVQVGAQRPHQRQEDESHQQGGQGQGHGSVGDNLQGQDLSVLWAGWLKTRERKGHGSDGALAQYSHVNVSIITGTNRRDHCVVLRVENTKSESPANS